MPAQRTIKVLPNPNHPGKLPEAKLRRMLAHPSSGGFPPDGPATWRLDQFTYRRLRDGDVIPADGQQQKLAAPHGEAPSSQAAAPRHQSHSE